MACATLLNGRVFDECFLTNGLQPLLSIVSPDQAAILGGMDAGTLGAFLEKVQRHERPYCAFLERDRVKLRQK